MSDQFAKSGNRWLITILALPAFIWMIPTLWMLSLSLQPNDLLARTTSNTLLGLVPIPFTFENYANLFEFGNVHIWFFNSLIVSAGMTLGVLILSATAGFAFARLQFRGKNLLFAFVMLGLMVPEQAVFIPLYLLFSDLDWHNSYQGLIVPRLAVPVGVFLMTQHLKGVSREIEEASVMDGANVVQIFWHIILPLARAIRPGPARPLNP